MKDGLSGQNFKATVYRELARVGKAISDPKRLELLQLLCQAERSVDHVAKELGTSIATVSHHLQVLKVSRLAVERRAGRFVFYAATEAGAAIWKMLADIGEASVAEVRLAVASFFDENQDYEPIEINSLRRRLRNGEVVLLDVRPADEYIAGHFPGALSVPLEELEAKIKTIPRNKEVIAYCRGPFCVLAHDAVAFLRKRGIRARHWRQGVLDWQRADVKVIRSNRLPARAARIGMPS